jgi:hypothetical protein
MYIGARFWQNSWKPGLPGRGQSVMPLFSESYHHCTPRLFGRWILPIIIAALSLAAVGCSRSASGEYVGSTATSVVRLQLVETPDKHVSGQMNVATLKPDGTIVSETLQISGTTDGDNLSLTASAPPVPLGPVFNLSGTYGWSSLNITESSLSGQLKTITMNRSGTKEYNAALSQLQKQSALILAAQAEAKAREEKQKAEAKAIQEKLDQEAKEVQEKQNSARQIQLLCDRMERFDKAASATLQRFPSINAKYHSITSRVQQYLERDQALAGDQNATYTRSEIRYQIGNGLYATGQLHFEVQSLQSDFNNRIVAEMRSVLTVRIYCSFHAQDVLLQPACKRFNDLYPTYSQVYADIARGLENLEKTYRSEEATQQNLQTAAQQIN